MVPPRLGHLELSRLLENYRIYTTPMRANRMYTLGASSKCFLNRTHLGSNYCRTNTFLI